MAGSDCAMRAPWHFRAFAKSALVKINLFSEMSFGRISSQSELLVESDAVLHELDWDENLLLCCAENLMES